ncbi:MAG: PspC domain-containing protein [Deltaproteobacteria bacterium]|jgi:phage shock protein PspC (stress-responsive transcriptional regulator)|nr:PspC domain-containing protein [Deltaproteobacteria bacterium]
MNSRSRRASNGPYRASHGLLPGVLQGLSNHFGLPVMPLRAAVVLLAVFLAFWPVVLAYVLAALLMPRDPRFGP